MKLVKLLTLCPMICAITCCNQSKSTKEPATSIPAAYTSSNSNCTAPASWFKEVNGTRKTPAPKEGSDSPFANNATVTNCDFHQWSWQKFLWLTNEFNDRPLFLNSLKQITAEGSLVPPGNGIELRDTAQASGKKDVLISNAAFGQDDESYTTYYSIHVNNQMYAEMQKYGPQFVTDSTSLKNTAFSVGSLEVKISWIDTRALSDTTSYFITQGQINGQSTRIGLLGMHVVGVVENHPEFVWATFEHEALAPRYDWSKATPSTDAPVTSTSNYPFFNKDSISSVINISSGNGIYQDVFSVYRYGVPVNKEIEGKFDVLKYMKTSQNGSQNFNNIREINKRVKSQLMGVWGNYFYNGSIWINTEGYETLYQQTALLDSLSYHLSQSEPGDLTRGSVSAYNITMETYVQVGFNPSSIHGNSPSKLVNCFSCHNSSNNSGNFNSPLLISHLFSGYIGTLKGFDKEEVKQSHVDGIRKQFLLRKSNQ